MSSAQPLRLELAASPGFALLILLVHGAAAACLLTVLSGWAASAGALLLVALGGFAAWDRALLRSRGSPRTIEIHATGEARCLFAGGRSALIRSLGAGSVNARWVALGMRAWARRSLLVTPGMLAPASFRLLRLWALWGRVPGVASRQPQAGS